jgi:predicted dehydrogenase
MDFFQDRVDEFGEKFGIPEGRRYTGLSGYKRMLDDGVDAVFIVTPPYFHPEQAAAAVDAGVNVYIAKPIAVDVPGCKSILASGKKARKNGTSFLVDFQSRSTEFFIEAIKRVHDGAIGDLVFGEAIYHARCPFQKKYHYLEEFPNDPANKLRAWGLDRALSGDIITEQNIHVLDVMNWIMGDVHPVSATGTGGRKVRKYGDCYDHFALIFEYPGKVGITFSSKQIEGYDTQPSGLFNRMFGSKGVLEAKFGGNVLIRGDNFYRGGATSDIGRAGVDNNITSFYDSITKGDSSNPTVEPSVQSNLVTILGREAAYSGEKVYWDKLINSEERLVADLKGLKD